jgi:tetratricopeptide (TPR) repeat protein
MTLSLNRISIYMPHRLNDEELIQGFIARNDVFEALIESLSDETPDSIPQHYLIIGQRGMGKTTLLRRIDVELRKNGAFNHLIPLAFPEEQYNLDRLSKLWLNCLDALADTLEVEGNKPLVEEMDETIQKLSKITDDTELAEKAFDYLKTTTTQLNRRPVLLIDNLNQVLDSLKENEQWQLRNLITKAGSPVLLGASTEPVQYEYQAPFYDAFRVFLLEKLSFEEVKDLLRSLSEKTGETELLKKMNTETARLRTLYALTGGNPRTTVMLFQVFAKGFSASVYEDLDALLEAVTPLYKARFEELSAQLQVVVDAIALHWDPIRLDDLRELTRLDNPQLSPQLKRLKEVGWINQMEGFKRKNGKESKGTVYEISERFFNVWYLMRRSSRRQRRELMCLAKFLEVFYGEDIEKAARYYLQETAKGINHATYGLAMAEAMKNHPLSKDLKYKAMEDLLEKNTLEEVKLLFEISEDYINEKEKFFIEEIKLAYNNKNYEKIIEISDKWIKLFTNNASAYNNRGFAFGELKEYEKAIVDYTKAIELDENHAFAYFYRGIAYHYLNEYEKAIVDYTKAIELDENDAFAYNNRGIAYRNLNEYEKAIVDYTKAIELDKNDAFAYFNRGFAYHYLNEYEKAIVDYTKAIELDENNAFAYNNRGIAYRNLNEYEKAIVDYTKAIELDGNYVDAYNSLGNIYLDILKEYEKAREIFIKAIAIDQNTVSPKFNLIFLLRDKLHNMQEAKKWFEEVKKIDYSEIIDSYNLIEAVFAFYDKNAGIGSDFLRQALGVIGENLPETTFDDWQRSAAVIVKLGYGEELLEVFRQTGHDKILRPFYEAVQALIYGTPDYLNSVAAELRESALSIYEFMKRYNEV